MKFPTVLAACLLAGAAGAAPDCAQLLAQTRDEQVRVPDWQAQRRVTGKERVYFHSAPDRGCRLREVFVVPGDALRALNEYATYTEVQYVHPRTGRISLGWVESGRLDEGN